MKVVKEAYGKINLGLDVIRRREDGYHDVKMIMQTVGLCDTITFETREDGEILIYTNKECLPCDEGNLIYKAILVYKKAIEEKVNHETADIQKDPATLPAAALSAAGDSKPMLTHGLTVTLEKRIPIAAGMAGGSTDAAATLVACNELAGNPLSREELLAIAVEVGADVPYCILGHTALSEGIGEILTPLPPTPQAHVLLAKPDIDVSTAFVYKNLKLDATTFHPDIDGMEAAIEAGDIKGVADRMANVLETVTIPAYPIIAEIKNLCLAQGALNALMSGSGPTVFALYKDEEKAKEAAEEIKEKHLAKEVYVTHFV